MSDRIDKEALAALAEKMAQALAESITALDYRQAPLSKNLLDRCREDGNVMLNAILPDIEKLLLPEGSVVLVPTNPKELAATGQAAFSTGNSFDEPLYLEWKP